MEKIIEPETPAISRAPSWFEAAMVEHVDQPDCREEEEKNSSYPLGFV